MAKKQKDLIVDEVVEETTSETLEVEKNEVETFEIEILNKITLAQDPLIYSNSKGTKAYDKGTRLKCNVKYKERYSKFPRFIKFL